MNGKSESSDASHKYRLKWGVQLWYIIFIAFIWVLSGSVLFFFGNALFVMVTATDQIDTATWAVPLFFSIFAVIFSILVILIFTTLVISLSRSFLKITRDGIEQKGYFPYKTIRCEWSGIEQLGKYFFSDVLYLKPIERVGLPYLLAKVINRLFPLQPKIYLSRFAGWPKGELTVDLKKYIPHLTEKKPPFFQYLNLLKK